MQSSLDTLGKRLSSLQLPVAQVVRRALTERNPAARHQLAFASTEVFIRMASTARIAFAVGHHPAADAAIVEQLDQLPRASLGHWVGFLRTLSTARENRTSPSQGDAFSNHDQALRHPLSEHSPAFHFLQRCVEESILSKEAATQGHRTGLLGFFECLVTYRNRVIGHGGPRFPGFYQEFADLLLEAVNQISTNPAVLGGYDLAICRWNIDSTGSNPRMCWQILRGLASLPATALGTSVEAPLPDQHPVPERLYLIGDSNPIPLFPLMVFGSDDSGHEHVRFFNRATIRHTAESGRHVASRSEYLDFATGASVTDPGTNEAVAHWFDRLTGTATSEADPVVVSPPDQQADGTSLPVPGTVIGDFRIEAEIDRGGMGVVYKAHQLSLDRPVALKIILNAQDANSRQRFLREARSMAKLSHPNVVEVHTFGELGGRPYLVMHLIDGETLADRLARDGSLEPEEALSIAKDVASALVAASAISMIHRDLKPSNIMIDNDGTIRVADFGLATSAPAGTRSDLSEAGTFVGTPDYASPEQLRGQAVDTRSDIYSLGLIIHETLTGKRPYEGSTPYAVIDQQLRDPLPRLRDRIPGIGRKIDQLLERMTEKDVERRISGATEVVKAIGDLLSGSSPTLPDRKSARMQTRLTPRVLTGIGLLITVLVAGLVLWQVVPSPQMESPAAIQSTTAPFVKRTSVAVLPFANITGEETLHWIAAASSEMLATELGASSNLRVIPGARVAEAIGESVHTGAESAPDPQIARLLGADLLVSGSVTVVGAPEAELVRIDVEINDPITGEAVARSGATGTTAQLFDVVERISNDLRETIGKDSVSPAEAIAVRATIPDNPAASKSFALGLKSLRKGNARAAQQHLETASEADPDNPVILFELARARWMLGLAEAAQEAAAEAVDHCEQVPRPLQQAMQARHDEYVGRWEEASEIYRRLFEEYPDDIDLGLRLVAIQTQTGAIREALAVLDDLERLDYGAGVRPRIELARAVALREQGELEAALEEAKSAQISADTVGSRVLRAQARMRTAELLQQLGDPEQALNNLHEARALFQDAGDQVGIAECLEAMAWISFDRGNLSEAELLFDNAVDLLVTHGDVLSAARVRLNLGSVSITRGNLDQAKTAYDESLAVFRSFGALADEAVALADLGAAYHLAGLLPEALNRYRDSLETYGVLGDQAGTALVLTNIGEVLYLQGNLGESRKMHEEALATNRQIGDRAGAAYDTVRLGLVLAAQGDLFVAKGRLREALDEQEKLDDTFGATSTGLALARVLLSEGQTKEATTLALRAEQIARTQGATDLQAEACAVLVEAGTSSWSEADSNRYVQILHDAADKSENPRIRVLAAASSIRLALATRDDESIERYSRLLGELADSMSELGILPFEFEARLALAETWEWTTGSTSPNTAALSLSNRARDTGFGWIADRAERILKEDSGGI